LKWTTIIEKGITIPEEDLEVGVDQEKKNIINIGVEMIITRKNQRIDLGIKEEMIEIEVKGNHKKEIITIRDEEMIVTIQNRETEIGHEMKIVIIISKTESHTSRGKRLQQIGQRKEYQVFRKFFLQLNFPVFSMLGVVMGQLQKQLEKYFVFL
jgi:hypothetical protein